MPVCCTCNISSRCRNCKCVKNGRKCNGCVPSRNRRCENEDSGIISNNDHNRYSDHSSEPPPNPDSDTTQAHQRNEHHNNGIFTNPTQSLPPFEEMRSPNFTWGNAVDGPTFCHKIEAAYKEVTKWRRNVFNVPTGKAGTMFVNELSRLLGEYGSKSPMEKIAISAAMIIPHLLLQKPHAKSKTRDHVSCLERRLNIWKNGNIESLMQEGRAIQMRLRNADHRSRANTSRAFAHLMFCGRTKAALKLITEDKGGGPLSPHSLVEPPTGQADKWTVLDELRSKHPEGKPASQNCIVDGSPNGTVFHPVIFDNLNGKTIRETVLRIQGSAGPSGIDASGWRRMCTSFSKTSSDLCNNIALMARRICTEYVDPEGLSSFTACRLIALDKNPGVRPIGVREVVRRIIGKAVLGLLKEDVQRATGYIQLCAGQECGSEVAIHAMREVFSNDDNEGVLLADASNAFNCLNRQATLINIHVLCPPLARILTNTYRQQSPLFIGEEIIYSKEGTTQGDPLAMPMYALGILPLIQRLSTAAKQVWFADDGTAGGKLDQIRLWWSLLNTIGPEYGYNPNAAKSWLIVKEEHFEAAERLFAGTGINVTAEGKRHLGAAMGTRSFVESYVSKKVEKWKCEIEKLSEIAKSQPHAAYTALTKGLCSRWNFLLRTVPNIADLLQPLEDAITQSFIPALIGRQLDDEERRIFALPCRMGGMGISNPVTRAPIEFETSERITSTMAALIINQSTQYSTSTQQHMRESRNVLKRERWQRQNDDLQNLNEVLTASQRRSLSLAGEKGASSWLTALPIENMGFTLHKRAFRDAVFLRYGWTPPFLPTNCICGKAFSVEHALSCNRGAFPIHRHNEIRDLTAELLTQVCHNVCLEPSLQKLDNEHFQLRTAITDDNARLDISADGFWERSEKAFFDVRVFNPFASTNLKHQLGSCYHLHEMEKRRQYDERVREVEQGSFAPLVFATSGGMGKQATVFYKRLASLLALKKDQPYSHMIGWIRCRLGFSLLRSSITCLRGTRSTAGFVPSPTYPDALDLTISEGQVAVS